MATATVPAAVPDPDEPHINATGSAPSGLLASMLAPVDPARPATFDIPAPATADGALDAPVAGASSAAYHGTDEASDTPQKGSGTADKKSVLRAFLLAAATRWAKGGGYQNKRLDLEKTKAARLAKEDRKVSINRTDGLAGKGSVGSGSGGNSGGGKGNSGGSAKGPVKGPVKGPKNSNGNAHQGPSGNSGGSTGPGRSGGGAGRGHGGGGSTGGNGSGASPKSPKPNGTSSGRDSKPEKVNLSKGRGHSGSDGGKTGTQGRSGSTGKNGNGASSGGSSGNTKGSGTGTKGSGTGTSADDSNGKSPARDSGSSKDHGDTKAGKKTSGQDTSSKTGKSPSKDAPGKEPRGTKDSKQPGSSGKDSAAKPGKTGTSDAATDKKDEAASPDTKTDKDKGGKDAQPQAKTEPGKKAGDKPFSVKESRQTGYRDGTRAAKAVAHAKAYCDGAKDGYRDVTEAAERQKAQLDKAHDERKKAQDTARDKETDVSGSGSSADHHKPQPIEVKGIDAKNLWLGEGADRNTLSRGEVRSLKHFERRLELRLAHLRDSVERTKRLKAHAEAQAKEIAAKKESAKSVKGGEKLSARLSKLEEDAKVQVGLADEIHKRAIRSADRCAATLANAKTRYGAMYQAVVDSDETAPAEMSFYLDGATTNG